MRKIFRMQYEPCNGDCYSYDDSDDDNSSESDSEDSDQLPLGPLRWDLKRMKNIIDKLVAMHQPLCGNVNLRYGIDLDETNNIFIGSFWHYGKLELFTGKDLYNLVESMADFILTFYTTEAYAEESKNDKGLGHSVCHYGEDQDLRRFMIRASRIPTPNGVDAFLEQLQSA